ncbi:MAG: mannonate dehydratase, partial [Pseudomonadota bacterium]
MRQTWRWFGPPDLVSIRDIAQAGAEGIVTALHHLPAGVEWTASEIAERQATVARFDDGTPSGLSWDVVESLPVSEDIKRQDGDWRAHLEAYRASLTALAEAGIKVICYNFMPVLDWTRTDLAHRRPNGATCMRFDWIDFAAFDLHILARDGAFLDYNAQTQEAASERVSQMTDARKSELAKTVTCGLPGAAAGFSLDDIRAHLSMYGDIDAERLRTHLIDFLGEVVPTAERLGLRLCCHPDDPPFSLMGLPRVMSTEADYQAILDDVSSPANGVTLCSGSLGARPDNDLPGMMERLGPSVHFLHLRNVRREGGDVQGSFFEDEHLSGGTDMIALLKAVVAEETRRRTKGREDASIPFRP